MQEVVAREAVIDGHRRPVENEHYRWIINWFPKMEGHTMIVPKRHILNLEEETEDEALSRHRLIIVVSRILMKLYNGAGIEIFLQTGLGSESSVPHLHWHICPSLPDDPVRGVGKLGQFSTTEDGKEKVVYYPVPIRLAREELQEELRKLL